MKRVLAILILGALPSFADPLIWRTPIGTFGLPFQATEALIGYDAALKEAIAGASLPIYADPLSIVALQVGAVAPWQTNGPTVEPYVALGHDFAREIPGLSDYQSLHLNAFGRYAPSQGKAGVGISFSYSFIEGALSKAPIQGLAAPRNPSEPQQKTTPFGSAAPHPL